MCPAGSTCVQSVRPLEFVGSLTDVLRVHQVQRLNLFVLTVSHHHEPFVTHIHNPIQKETRFGRTLRTCCRSMVESLTRPSLPHSGDSFATSSSAADDTEASFRRRQAGMLDGSLSELRLTTKDRKTSAGSVSTDEAKV